MSFDLFVQSCISLKRMTDVFKRYDDDRDGFVTLSFEEFLSGEFFLVVLFPLLVSSSGGGRRMEERKEWRKEGGNGRRWLTGFGFGWV